jgi:hypothetical protein
MRDRNQTAISRWLLGHPRRESVGHPGTGEVRSAWLAAAFLGHTFRNGRTGGFASPLRRNFPHASNHAIPVINIAVQWLDHDGLHADIGENLDDRPQFSNVPSIPGSVHRERELRLRPTGA